MPIERDADLGRSRTHLGRSRSGRVQQSGSLTRCGPGTEPDPRLSYQARPWLIRSRAVRVGRSLQAPPLTWAGAGPTTELSSQTVAVWSRAGRIRVGRSGSPTRCGPGPEPDLSMGRSQTTQGYTSVTRARDANARTAVRREATSKDPGLRKRLAWFRGLCPMCPDSDGF